MKDIRLVKPVIVRSSLKDMCPACREQAEKFLDGKEVINNDGEIIPAEKMDKDSITGSEAVAFFREFLDLNDVSIKSIPVNSILTEVDDIDQLMDILTVIKGIKFRNKILDEMIRDDVTPSMQNTIYRDLQTDIEYLLDNNWCNDPLRFKLSSGKEYVLASLKDAGLGVGTTICRT